MLNPYQILGVSEKTNDEAIRTAYLAKLRENPPDANQQQFQQIQQAYALVKDIDARLHYLLFHVEHITSELIAQSIQTDDQSNKRVDLQTLQAVFKTFAEKVSPPITSEDDG